MADDLIARCLAEVERAMADELHTPSQNENQRLAARLARMMAVMEAERDHLDYDPKCPKCQALAARLARMMAAGIEGTIDASVWVPSPSTRLRFWNSALRAVARVREAP